MKHRLRQRGGDADRQTRPDKLPAVDVQSPVIFFSVAQSSLLPATFLDDVSLEMNWPMQLEGVCLAEDGVGRTRIYPLDAAHRN
jgi:hypothetical protein